MDKLSQISLVYRLFSIANLWEIGIKLGLARGDFVLADDWWRDFPQALTRQGVLRLDMATEHCREVARLRLHHRDPFDRTADCPGAGRIVCRAVG